MNQNLQSATAGLYTAYYKTNNSSSIVYSDHAKSAGNLLYGTYKIEVMVDFDDTDASAPTAKGDGTYDPAFWKDGGTVKWRDKNGKDWIESEVVTALQEKSVKFAVTAKTDRYELTADTTVVTGKRYFTNNTGNAASPTGSENPNTQGWYEYRESSRAKFFAAQVVDYSATPISFAAGNNITASGATSHILTGISSSADTWLAVGWFAMYIEGEPTSGRFENDVVTTDFTVTVSEYHA